MDDAAPLADSAPVPQPELAPAPSVSAPGSGMGMLGMVLPVPTPAPPLPAAPRVALRRVRHVFGEAVAWVVVALVLALLLAPAMAFFVAGCWAIVTYIASAVTVYELAVSARLADLLGPLQQLDMAGRVAAASAGYYALLCGLLVLVAGLLGKRWRRLFLFPGIVLSLPAALAFYFALRLTLDAVAASVPLPFAARTGLTIYLLLDAVLLGVFLVDLRPKPRRRAGKRHGRRRRKPRGESDALPAGMGQPSAPSMPLVHFGPPSLPLIPPAPPVPNVRLVPVLTAPGDCTSLHAVDSTPAPAPPGQSAYMLPSPPPPG